MKASETIMARAVARIALDPEVFAHSVRVAANVGPLAEPVTVAYLHDVLEDSRATVRDLLDLGFSRGTLRAVELLTRRDDETYADYINRIAESGNRFAIEVKEADLRDHLEQAETLRESLRPRYEKALKRLTAIEEQPDAE